MLRMQYTRLRRRRVIANLNTNRKLQDSPRIILTQRRPSRSSRLPLSHSELRHTFHSPALIYNREATRTLRSRSAAALTRTYPSCCFHLKPQPLSRLLLPLPPSRHLANPRNLPPPTLSRTLQAHRSQLEKPTPPHTTPIHPKSIALVLAKQRPKAQLLRFPWSLPRLHNQHL